ncbi:oxygenase MpaB family protein [Nocardia rhamnosiphila]|uniref:Oxygenase MpaB family protein n=1 Tax=Nocardia rhamnosiphila TaxID=426716 RepID=A0ABV2WIF9_9NOCA|nr:oxygenase MpaB family protein [Nocardia rhamnosiphila]
MTTHATAHTTEAADPRVRPEVLREFRKHSGSVLAGAFAGAAFDEVALAQVAAAVDRTGRFEENFTDRTVRGGASAMIALWGDSDDRRAESEWLKLRHRDVRGTGSAEFGGVEYSALTPHTWKWVAVSGIFVVLNTFTYCTGTELRPEEEEAAYQLLRGTFVDLELPSAAGKFPADLAEAREYYDTMATGELAENPFLVEKFAALTKLPLPTSRLSPLARRALTPLWLVIRPVVGHVIQVCSSKAMHPAVQELTGFELKPRHDREFAICVRLLRWAWHHLPDRVLLQPLAYNRFQYEKLVDTLRGFGLDSFAIPEDRR